MKTQENLNNIYKLYSEQKYSEAFILVQEILKTEPENAYAKRYEQLLRPYLNDKSEVGKIATIKGKNLKCPHCQSAISLSALNDEQKTKIRDNNYANLSLKCPYCHTQFTLQKKTFESYIGIDIGDKIQYNNKKYRVVGGVDYTGNWFEGSYWGGLFYVEWILLGEDNSYLYFSEGYFLDEGKKTYEFEFSEKIIPDFSINLLPKSIEINGKKVKISERNTVKAQKIYGENSKVFTVGEEVNLYEFSYGGKDYVLEKESAGRQSEAGIYTTKTVGHKEACEIFGKEYKFNFAFSKANFHIDTEKNLKNIIIGAIIGIPVLQISFSFFGAFISGILIFAIVGTWIYLINKEIFYSKIFHLLISGPFFAGVLFFGFQNIFETKKEIPLQNLSEGKKFEIVFENPELKQTQEIGRRRYDYGGIETTFEEKTGLSFSVKSDEDKKIIEKIKNNDTLSEEVQKVFQEKIYQLR